MKYINYNMMKNFVKFAIALFFIPFFLFSCESDNEESGDDPVDIYDRTVIIYMAAENDLNSHWSNDYEEIVRGAKNLSIYQNLIVYVDRKSTSEKPYIAKISADGAKKVRQFDKDSYACDPAVMKDVINWTINKYPSKSYGIVFWGHSDGTGWYMQDTNRSYSKQNIISFSSGEDDNSDSIIPLTRAFMFDNGTDLNSYAKWMNIPTFGKTLSELPHFDFIFFDVCSMMTTEVLYEIRNSCDYVIGSPSEVPGCGAPYDYVVSDLFLPMDQLGAAIINDYANKNAFAAGEGVPMSVVKTRNMEALARATSDALKKFKTDFTYPKEPSINGCIYYYAGDLSLSRPMMVDLRDFMLKNLSENDFKTWETVFKATVVNSLHPAKKWLTIYQINFDNFKMTDENFGGLSFFVPQAVYSQNKVRESPNIQTKYLELSKIIDWSKWGWDK